MLEDDALKGPVLTAIAEGAAADEAWRQVLDAEIEGYAAAEDDYFRARAADLEDKTEKHVSMENRLYPVREMLGDMLMEAGQPALALQA